MGFASGFQAGYSTVDSAMERRREEEQRKLIEEKLKGQPQTPAPQASPLENPQQADYGLGPVPNLTTQAMPTGQMSPVETTATPLGQVPTTSVITPPPAQVPMGLQQAGRLRDVANALMATDPQQAAQYMNMANAEENRYYSSITRDRNTTRFRQEQQDRGLKETARQGDVTAMTIANQPSDYTMADVRGLVSTGASQENINSAKNAVAQREIFSMLDAGEGVDTINQYALDNNLQIPAVRKTVGEYGTNQIRDMVRGGETDSATLWETARRFNVDDKQLSTLVSETTQLGENILKVKTNDLEKQFDSITSLDKLKEVVDADDDLLAGRTLSYTQNEDGSVNMSIVGENQEALDLGSFENETQALSFARGYMTDPKTAMANLVAEQKAYEKEMRGFVYQQAKDRAYFNMSLNQKVESMFNDFKDNRAVYMQKKKDFIKANGGEENPGLLEKFEAQERANIRAILTENVQTDFVSQSGLGTRGGMPETTRFSSAQ